MAVRPASSSPDVAAFPAGRATLLAQRRVAVTVLAGSLAALAFATYSALGDRLVAAFMALVLVTIAATDLERRIIPNRVVLPATAIVLAARLVTSPGQSADWILAALGAGLFFLLPSLVNPSAIGMGDVKLAAFLGAGLGTAVIGALLVAFLSIFPFALGILIRGGLAARKTALPFGPFLAFGGLVILILPRLLGLGGG